MAISKIIHQTWKSEDLPQSFRCFQKTWRHHHPGWEYRFYDDDACRRVVEDGFPEIIPIYDSCPHPVQRADIFRYLVVALFGGVYADMDMECIRSFDSLLEGHRAVFCVEDVLSPRRARLLNLRHPERIANFIFAAEPGHAVFSRIVTKLKALPGSWNMHEEVLDTTGPGMLTDVVQDARDQLQLTVLPRACCPHPKFCFPNRFPFNLHMYARHHFMGTWKTAKFLEAEKQHPVRSWDLRELWYSLPPSPVWKQDLCFWKKNNGRS